MTVEKNKVYSGLVTELQAFGSGVVYINDFPIIVPNAIPGDRVMFKVIKRDSSKAVGKLLDIAKPSDDRRDTPCRVASSCGGCQIQHMTYTAQLAHKAALIKTYLPSFSGDILANESQFNYRNKLQMSFGKTPNGTPTLGLYAAHSNRVIDTQSCDLMHSSINTVFKAVRNWMEQLPNTDALAHIMIRHSTAHDSVMAVLIVTDPHFSEMDSFVAALSSIKQVKSIWMNENSLSNENVLGDNYTLSFGDSTISDSLLGVSFSVSPQSFVQNNPTMTHKLYEHVKNEVSLSGAKTAWDLYSGIGVMTLYISAFLDHITGVEMVKEAISDANSSMRLNTITNCDFVCADATEFVNTAHTIPDLVILDPPRRGCSESLLKRLADKCVSSIIYISCSPQSLGRDIKVLLDLGYTIESAQAFDCFSQTVHVETVVRLSLCSTK